MWAAGCEQANGGAGKWLVMPRRRSPRDTVATSNQNPTMHVPTSQTTAPDLESAGGGLAGLGWAGMADGRHEMPRPLSPPQSPATENSNLSHPPTRTTSAVGELARWVQCLACCTLAAHRSMSK